MSHAATKTIMSRNPITCGQDDPTSAVAQRMWEHDIGALPVVDGAGRAIGMITDRDIAMAAYIQGKPLDQITVRSAMSNQLRSVRPDAPVTEAEQLMQQHQIRRIAVVDDGGRPVGMLSLNDLARRAGPSRGATVSQDELAQTLRAVCQPRSGSPQPHAVAQ